MVWNWHASHDQKKAVHRLFSHSMYTDVKIHTRVSSDMHCGTHRHTAFFAGSTQLDFPTEHVCGGEAWKRCKYIQILLLNTSSIRCFILAHALWCWQWSFMDWQFWNPWNRTHTCIRQLPCIWYHVHKWDLRARMLKRKKESHHWHQRNRWSFSIRIHYLELVVGSAVISPRSCELYHKGQHVKRHW